MAEEITAIISRIKHADDPRDLLFDYAALLSHCQDPAHRGAVLAEVRKQETSQKIGYLFEVTASIDGFSYLKPMAETLFDPPRHTTALTPHSHALSRLYSFRAPEPVSTRWRMESRTSPEEIAEFLELYGAQYGIRQEIGKRRVA